LGDVRRRLRDWRATHGGRGRALPTALWEEAVALARVEGVEPVARELGIDRRRLARLVGPELSEARILTVVEQPPRAEFVELDSRTLCPAGHAVVQLEGRDGERVRVEVHGAASVDVLAVARAFWGRARCSS
jgi:hypothetical protein